MSECLNQCHTGCSCDMGMTLRFMALGCFVNFLPCPARQTGLDTARTPRKSPQVYMENVVLIIHLLLALSLIAVVLMQRSEGGGLGMGGGGGGGAMTGRTAATALTKLTWILATAFIITSITLTILAAQRAAGTSVIDRMDISAPADPDQTAPATPFGNDLLPPAEGGNAPLLPRAD